MSGNQQYTSYTGYSSNTKHAEDDAFDPNKLRSSNVVRGNTMLTEDATPLSYYDDNSRQREGHQRATSDAHDSLVDNAAPMPRAGRDSRYQDLEYSDPHNDPTRARGSDSTGSGNPFSKFMSKGKYPLSQRIEDKKRGIGRQKYPFVSWVVAAICVGVFIYELVLNNRETGSVLSFKPVVNPMLGPSSTVLVNAGARFPPCMKAIADFPTQLACMSNTANPATEVCSVEQVCGFGGFNNKEPNQWFRFITPIFLHAGIIHLLLNMFAQLTLSSQVEREMGSMAFFLTYFAAGIFGNVFGANFSRIGIPSVGASGAIVGTYAVGWVDLGAHWKYQHRPVRTLVFKIIELAIIVAIGFIPFVDNFSHLGGFLMGLLVAAVVYPVISETQRHKLIMWAIRLVAVALAIALFVTLTRNFYSGDPYAACTWCRYLSCIPTSSNNQCKGTGLTGL